MDWLGPAAGIGMGLYNIFGGGKAQNEARDRMRQFMDPAQMQNMANLNLQNAVGFPEYMGSVGDFQKFAQGGPAQVSDPMAGQAIGAQGMGNLNRVGRKLESFDPKLLRQERTEARQRLATPGQYITGGAGGEAAKAGSRARDERRKFQDPRWTSSTAGARADVDYDAAVTGGLMGAGQELEREDRGFSRGAARDIGQMRLSGLAAAPGAFSAGTQAGLAGLGMDRSNAINRFQTQGQFLQNVPSMYGLPMNLSYQNPMQIANYSMQPLSQWAGAGGAQKGKGWMDLLTGGMGLASKIFGLG
jgi:hypothetical protein